MIGHGCCITGSNARLGRSRRILQFAKWFTPGAILILIPKCPLCIVAYVAAITGIGLSIPAATGLRMGLISASIAGIAYLVLGPLLRRWRRIN